MTKSRATLNALLLTLGGALLATACTVTLDPSGSGGDDGDAQCLELFETCVEQVGDSPGCDAVFEFCAGSGSDSDSGGDSGDPDPGCEDEYIQCLSEGLSPDECEPLLEECYGGGDEGGGDEGGCDDPDNPECDPCADGSCEPPDPADCEQLFENCAAYTGEEAACEELVNICYEGDGDCGSLLEGCYNIIGEGDVCQEITGCYVEDPPPPADDCDALLNECYDEFGDEDVCVELYPECYDIDPPEPSGCEWYYGEECHSQFAHQFCDEAAQGCEVGFLPEQFQCSDVFPDYCWDISDSACNQAEEACWNGFHDVELCGSLADDPSQFLQELAGCNGWE